jgi:hypothetical protein
MLEGGQRLGPGDGEAERLERAGTVREAVPDERRHLDGDPLGPKAERPREDEIGPRPLAVLGAEVPPAAWGLALGRHEETRPPARRAVEGLRPQRASPGLGGERRGRAEEPPVVPDPGR